MKNSIYDRIPATTTADLIRLSRSWARMINAREKTPRFDYYGRCLNRTILELERRGAFSAISPTEMLESSSDKESRDE